MIDDSLHTTTTASSGSALTLDDISKAIEGIPAPAKPKQYVQFGGKSYPIKDFELTLEPYTGIDVAPGPDVTMLSTWQRNQLMATVEVKPMACSWALPMFLNYRPTPYTLKELRQLRKKIRDKKGKQLLKRMARNPDLCEQDPRKLRRLARIKQQNSKKV